MYNMDNWIVDLDNNSVRYDKYHIVLKFKEIDGKWTGLLGPTDCSVGGDGIPLSDLPALMKEGDDAFRTAKGLELQNWDFLKSDEFLSAQSLVGDDIWTINGLDDS